MRCTGTKIIAVSGFGEDEIRRDFPFIDGVLQKPVDPDFLCKEIIPKVRREFFPSDE